MPTHMARCVCHAHTHAMQAGGRANGRADAREPLPKSPFMISYSVNTVSEKPLSATCSPESSARMARVVSRHKTVARAARSSGVRVVVRQAICEGKHVPCQPGVHARASESCPPTP